MELSVGTYFRRSCWITPRADCPAHTLSVPALSSVCKPFDRSRTNFPRARNLSFFPSLLCNIGNWDSSGNHVGGKISNEVFLSTQRLVCFTRSRDLLSRFFFYKNISLQIMGKWYVVEVLEHRLDPMKPASSSYIVDSCPIVKLKPLDHAALKLLWSEESGNVEYTFRIPDISRRKGLWRATTSQNGKISFISTRSSNP